MNGKSFYHNQLIKFLFVCVAFLLFQNEIHAQSVKRVVIVKTDGLPNYTIDRFVKQRDPKTGKSLLPWFDEVFYKNGVRLENFYSRGMSLSAPSWSLLDTGQHLQLKGNVEFDRFAVNQYDYLNFVPFYISYGLRKKVDMPATELMDQLGVPLLSDAFPFEKKYVSPQLLGRGNEWMVLKKGFANMIPRNAGDLIDEWTVGLDFYSMTNNQNEREIVKLLKQNPEVEYLDYYTANFDHTAHSNHDVKSQFAALKEIDGVIGRFWTTIQNSPLAAETALVVVSDHGFNSDEKIYSQGFNLVKIFGSAAGGGHHAVTKRRLMLDYSLKGIYPLTPLITTTSENSYYLKGQSTVYPTVLLDFDGNERASVHLRDADFNTLHILLQKLKDGKLATDLKRAATEAFFKVLDRRRENWRKTIAGLNEELDNLHEWIEAQRKIIAAQPKKYTPEELAKNTDKDDLRIVVQHTIAVNDEKNYRAYAATMSNLLALKRENFDATRIKIEEHIPKGIMGENNSLYQLQNYPVGLSEIGLMLDADGVLDLEKSFKRVNYFSLLGGQTILNNVQARVGSRPIDFIAIHLPLASITASLPPDLKSDEDPIWLYGDAGKQAFVLTRRDAAGNKTYRYVPIADLRQRADGKYTFQMKDWSDGFPLKIYEDANLNVPGDRAAWLNDWHDELEWLHAAHKTVYSNAVINLTEQLNAHSFLDFGDEAENLPEDKKPLRRFRRMQRQLTETDLLIMASDHWNFDVRGFNPGGNHGSFRRVAANSTLMLAGGKKTNIARGLVIEEPYDNLSFVPTVFSLLGKVSDAGEPDADLTKRGFKKFPGRIIKEINSADRFEPTPDD